MLERSDKPISEVIRKLAEQGVEAAYLVPTDTGLQKSILDAHGSMREFLKFRGLHDYSTQPQGEAGKRMLQAWFVGERDLIETKVALYRPDSKSGDPRIWPYSLKNYCRPWNLLAMMEIGGKLYFLNASDPAIFTSIDNPNSAFGKVLYASKRKAEDVVERLLTKLRDVSGKGFIDTLKAGDTGVGFTLETLLGIPANSSRLPDFEGIEIKSARIGETGQRPNRVNLFSQVPTWKISNLKKGLQILDRYGYPDVTGTLALRCTVSAKPNLQGLYLAIDGAEDTLENLSNMYVPKEKVVCWNMEKLRSRLAQKHDETFWVKAQQRTNAVGKEQFHYVEVEHTHGPLVDNFGTLVEIGAITMDYTFHEEFTQTGRRKARDHGYLFKILPTNLDLLFPPSKNYSLAS